MSEKLKNGIKILVGHAVISQAMQNIVLINNSRTAALPTKILMSFLSFSDHFLQDAYTILFKVNDFGKKQNKANKKQKQTKKKPVKSPKKMAGRPPTTFHN